MSDTVDRDPLPHRDAVSFKKFTERRCMTLINKANELYQGYVRQNCENAVVSILVDDGEKKVVFMSNAVEWPFNFEVRHST